MEDQATLAALSLLTLLAYALVGLAAAVVLSLALSIGGRLLRRRSEAWIFVSRRLRTPQRVFLALLGIGLGVSIAGGNRVGHPAEPWHEDYVHGLVIVLILAGASVLSAVVLALSDLLLARMLSADGAGRARRVDTQMQMLGRVMIALIWFCAIAGALLTFDSFRAVGTSLLASAGVLSVVAGLAAQSSLANLIAGLQITFTDALRVGDTISVENSMGTVEEVTLTYVVLRVWDERRLVIPSTFFTQNSFENWSKQDPAQLGVIEFDLDWLVPVEAMRLELERVLAGHELWDRRSSAFQVTDATGGTVRVRALVSARDSAELWNLRCDVREHLLRWLQEEAPFALPRFRLEPQPTSAPEAAARQELAQDSERRLHAERAKFEREVEQLPTKHPREPDDTDPLLAAIRRSRRRRRRSDQPKRPDGGSAGG